MEIVATYRGRSVSESDIAVIKKTIAAHPEGSRRFISQEVCRAWEWRQANGTLKDMVCRSLLLLLQSEGLIKLPPPKCKLPNPLANRKNPVKIEVDRTPTQCPINELFPIHLKQVRRTRLEKLFNSLISEHHYLGYTQPVGEHLKYIAFSNDRPIACLAWSSAPWYIGARDKFIGWSPQTRQKNLCLIINNTRFLVLPWVEVSHLASHLLALNRRRVSEDWGLVYNHPVYLLETFVDTDRYQGTCYKADNWIYVGKTTGRGKLSKSRKPTLSKKAVYVYPLTKDFRYRLNTQGPVASRELPSEEARQC
ncbi:MAG: DUF4338 domain-containing protein [Desulfobacteraceae bacterium]|nr:DUF4338 domain-containing protein [Desulfobacteraceae bacterium]